jgi:4-carboxymuconolactone decarboxylase
MLPADIDPESRCRLPLVKREHLDDHGKKIFDSHVDPKGGTIRGLKGPGGLGLHSPELSHLTRPVGRYLRFEAPESPRIRETAILITARMCDSRFEWAAHEPEALSVGVPQKVIDVIKFHRRVTGLDDTDQIIITLGRETFGKRKVSSKTYARAFKRFGAKGLINLVALMGNYASTAALLTVFDMQLDDGPDVCRLPVG